MPADDVLRVGEGGGKALALDQIRTNSSAVIEDHHRYNEAQSQRADSVRPPSFEECLAMSYELAPEPLPEAAVPEVTREASRALEDERGRAGGIIAPQDQARQVPEPVDEVPGVAPGPPPATAPNPDHLVDFYQVSKLLGEMRQALEGMNARVESWERGAVPSVPTPEVSSAKAGAVGAVAPVSVEPGAAPEPRKAGPPPKPQSIQERRAQRAGGATVPEGPGGMLEGSLAPAMAEGGVEVPGPLPPRTEASSPRRRWGVSMPQLRLPFGRAIALAAGGLGLAAVLVVLLGRRRGEVSAEALLVERQVQGVGSYVRAEERELTASLRRVATIEREMAQIRIDMATAQSDLDQRDLRRRLGDAQKRLERSSRAAGGLRALEEVSGIRVGQ